VGKIADGRVISPWVLEVPELILTSAPVLLFACSDENLVCLVFPQCQIVAANFDFNRVAQRCKTHEFDFCAHQQSHFHQAGAALGWQLDFSHGGASPDAEQA
jgi:hypothetical protein